MFTRLFMLAAVSTLFSLNITFTEKPANYQLFPRNDANIGTIPLKGVLRETGFDSMSVVLTRNSRPCSRTSVPVVYGADTALFDFQIPIQAELAEYGVSLFADTVLAFSADSLVAGDAYAVSGTSNAITFIVGDVHEYIRTFKGAPGRWKISEQGNEYSDGPDVGVWAQQLGFHINQEQGLPVVIINGGTPSMAITYFVPGASGYLDVLNRADRMGVRNQIKAVFFDEGYAEATPAGILDFANQFRLLYLGWKADYPALKKAYVSQIGYWFNSYEEDIPLTRNIRELQRRLPETCPDVSVMATVGSPEPAVHWGAGGYRSIGDKLYRLVAHDVYNSADTSGITPPNLLRAYYSSAAKDRITLLFNQPTYWKDSLGHRLADYFALDSAYKQVDSGWHEPEHNRVVLKLKAPSSAVKISYLTAGFYHADDRAGVPSGYFPVYQGPFLFNSRRVGALAFHEVPIEDAAYSDTSLVTALVLNSPKNELLRFESALLLAIVSYQNGESDTNKAIAFRSLDTFVVTVDAKGLVRGFNPGTAQIMAIRDGHSDTVTITVHPEFAPLAGLDFTTKAKTLLTLLAGDSAPIGLAALKVENGDTLRFAMDTLASITAPMPQLELRGNFIYAMQGGESLMVRAEAAGLRCSTQMTAVPMPSFIRRVNFQASNAPLTSIPGWILDSGTPYSQERGLGWVNASLSGYSIADRDPNYFRNTMLVGPQNQTEQIFRIDAPAGRYLVRIRNFNLFACFENSWVRFGADTILHSPACNYQWDADAQVTRVIDITGDSGLVLHIYGAICYLVLVSDDGTDFNLVVKDEMGPLYPPRLTTLREDNAVSADLLSETPAACPNPFNPATVVRFKLPAKISADYGIYNIRGQRCAVFHLASAGTAREARVVFNARESTRLASGLYYGRLVRSDGKTFSHKLILVR